LVSPKGFIYDALLCFPLSVCVPVHVLCCVCVYLFFLYSGCVIFGDIDVNGRMYCYIYVCMCVHIYVCAVCMDVCVFTDVSVGCASVHECGSMVIYMYVCACIYMCVQCVWMCVCLQMFLSDVQVCMSVGVWMFLFFFLMMCLAGYIPAAVCQTAHSSDTEITEDNRNNYGNKTKN